MFREFCVECCAVAQVFRPALCILRRLENERGQYDVATASSSCLGAPAGFGTRMERHAGGTVGCTEGRVAHVWRGSRQHAVFPARPDQRGQLQQARGRLEVQDRCARAAARVQFPVDAADGRGRAVHHRGLAPRGRRARRRHRRNAVDAQRERRRAWRGRTPAVVRTRPCVLDRRQRGAHPVRHSRLPARCARCEDRCAGRRFRHQRRRGSEAGRRPGHGFGDRRISVCMPRRSSRKT